MLTSAGTLLARSLLAVLLPCTAVGHASREVDFATLSDFEYVEGMTLPEHVTELDGEEVTIAGFMRREDGGTGETEEFMLINDACGCTGTPFLNEIVFCVMPVGEKVQIQPGIVQVTGTLYVGEVEDGGIVVSLYTMDVESVDS